MDFFIARLGKEGEKGMAGGPGIEPGQSDPESEST